jgi:hypothetical protein
MSKATDLSQIPNASLGFKNRIINGDCRIDQRNAGASVTPTTVQYTLDRWAAIVSVTSKFSVQQDAGAVTPPVGFNDYLGCTSLSAYSVGAIETFAIAQSIEGFNVADLDWGTANAKTVTLSFWVRSSLTGTFGGSLRNSASDRSYPYTYTISAANTWEYKTITIAGDTTGTWLKTNGIGVQVIIGLGSGSTRSGAAGSWSANNFTNATGATSVVGTNGATFYITGVQLEKGTQATSFEYRQYQQELALCQWYCRTLSSESAGDRAQFSGVALANNTIIASYTFPTMRAAPTATITNPTSLDVVTSVVTTTNNTLSFSNFTSNSSQPSVANTGTPFTAGHGAVIRSDGFFVVFSAEL